MGSEALLHQVFRHVLNIDRQECLPSLTAIGVGLQEFAQDSGSVLATVPLGPQDLTEAASCSDRGWHEWRVEEDQVGLA